MAMVWVDPTAAPAPPTLPVAIRRKHLGNTFRQGVSVDQFIAQKIGNRSRFGRSSWAVRKAFKATIATTGTVARTAIVTFRGEHHQLRTLRRSALALFSTACSSPCRCRERSRDPRQERTLSGRSVLDSVLDDARRLQSNLGTADRRKVDQYRMPSETCRDSHRES